MNAASLHRSALLPVAASPWSVTAPTVSGGGGITPMAGQGFVPAGSAAPAAGAPAPSAPPASGPAPADGSGAIDAEQALQALVKVLGAEYSAPIVAADGTVYMEKKKPGVANGQIALAYVRVGAIDRSTGKMTIDPAILAVVKQKAAGAAERKLVKVDNSYVWQTFTKGEDGKTTATVEPATDEEVAAYQQQQEAAQAEAAKKAKLENAGDWQGKIGQVSSALGLFGSTGQLVMGLSGGPDTLSGKPGAAWISGWMVAQKLNGKAEGKLLPQWMQSGWVSSALEWGLQAYGMLDMGKDIRTVSDFVHGRTSAQPLVNPDAYAQLVKSGEAAPMAKAMVQLGTELRTPMDPAAGPTPTMQSLDGTGNTALINNKLGAAQLVPTATLNKAFNATDPVTDPLLKAKNAVDGGITKGLGMLKGLVQPAMMGATALNMVSSAIAVKNLVAQNGAKVLIDTKQGRGALLGAISSAAYLGLYMVPMLSKGLGLGLAASGALGATVNIVANVLGGVQMLNSYGLFGEKGFLNHDAVRAAFLIPPLTPIGAFAFLMKNREKKKAVEAAKLQAAQNLAVQQIQQQRENAKLQLQQTGHISGAAAGQDGTITVPTNVPNDLSKLAAQMSGAAPPPPTRTAAPAQ